MSNFIDRFEAQLLATAPRPLRAHERLRRWIAGHAVASIAIAVTATAATAGAAVTTLTGTPSAPLSNKLPSPPGLGIQSGGHYRIAMVPSTAVGQPGWCTFVSVTGTSEPHYGFGCGASAVRGQHVITGSFDGSNKQWIAYFVVDDTVAGIRLGNGHVVLSRADSGVPPGLRVVVVVSGEPGIGQFDNRDGRKWKLVDDHGRVIGAAENDAEANRRVVQFVRGSAKTVTVRRAELPPSAPCQIVLADHQPWPEPIYQSIGLAAAPQPATYLIGQPFLACAQVQIGAQGHVITAPHATLLLDANDPGSRPAPLPGMSGPDDGSVVDVPVGGPPPNNAMRPPTGSAQRRGNAWLVVDGGTPVQQRALLARLQAKVDLG